MVPGVGVWVGDEGGVTGGGGGNGGGVVPRAAFGKA